MATRWSRGGLDGEDASSTAHAVSRRDLVLLDVMMPKLDGISVVRELKQDNTLRFTPIILVTPPSPDTRDVVIGLVGRRGRLSH